MPEGTQGAPAALGSAPRGLDEDEVPARRAASSRVHQVTGVGSEPEGDVEDAASPTGVLRAGALCADTRVLPSSGEEGWRVLGDTTEGPIVVAATKTGLGLDLDAESGLTFLDLEAPGRSAPSRGHRRCGGPPPGRQARGRAGRARGDQGDRGQPGRACCHPEHDCHVQFGRLGQLRRCRRLSRQAPLLPRGEVATMNIVAAGAGAVGVQVATALIDAGNAVALVDADPQRAAQLTDRGLTGVAGDGGVTTTLEEAGALRADVLVACTGHDAEILVIAPLARRHLEIRRVVARVNNERHRWLFDETWGVDAAISSAISLVHLIEKATGSARTVRLADLSSVGLVLVEATVTATSAALGQLLADLALGRDDLAAAVVRHGRSISTTAARQLRAQDRVLVVTPPDGEARVHHAFHPEEPGPDVGVGG